MVAEEEENEAKAKDKVFQSGLGAAVEEDVIIIVIHLAVVVEEDIMEEDVVEEEEEEEDMVEEGGLVAVDPGVAVTVAATVGLSTTQAPPLSHSILPSTFQ